MKNLRLSIDNPMLISAKAGLDVSLQSAVKKAIDTGSMEGCATLKINFELHKTINPDTGEIEMVPLIKSKFGYAVPMKYSGDINLTQKCRIVQKEDGDMMLMSDQMTIEELMEEESNA